MGGGDRGRQIVINLEDCLEILLIVGEEDESDHDGVQRALGKIGERETLRIRRFIARLSIVSKKDDDAIASSVYHNIHRQNT